VETAHQLSTLLRLQGLTRASRRRMARPASRLEGILRRAYARDPLGETVIARLVSNGVGYADARGTLSMLVLAGTITTAAAIPRMVALLIDSDAMRLLREDSSRIPAAVDGALRLLAPLPLTMRFAAEATRLGGVGLRAGERILVLTMNVTRDPLVVPEPNVMVLGSRPVAGSQRSWYGDGAHFCLGFALAQEQLSGVLRWLVGLPGTPAIVRRRPAFDTLLPRYDRLDLALHSSTRRAPR
jgi:cytochrome P450